MIGEKLDVYDIKAVPVSCDINEIKINGKKFVNNFHKDSEDVKRFYSEKLTRNRARRDPVMAKVLKESLLIHRHMDRHLHSMQE